MAETHEKSEFYFIANIDNPSLKGENFGAICKTIDVRCIMINETAALIDNAEEAREIISQIQSQDVAVLINTTPERAEQLNADGVHIDLDHDVDAQVPKIHARLGGDAIIGTDVGASRHDAMVRAEMGVDYIAFHAHNDEILDMFAWWNELFEIPSIAWKITDPEFAGTCAKAGADFIAIDLESLNSRLLLADKSPVEALKPFQLAIDNIKADLKSDA